MHSYLEFEKSVQDLEGKIAELKSLAAGDQAVSIDEEVSRLSSRADEALIDIYRKLTPWQKTQV
jgi:acetyl-CoA carboxylase carboxyl transferase subunit alpha